METMATIKKPEVLLVKLTQQYKIALIASFYILECTPLDDLYHTQIVVYQICINESFCIH